MQLYQIDESTNLFGGPYLMANIQFRDHECGHALVAKPAYDAGMLNIPAYRTKIINLGVESADADTHISTLQNAPQMKASLDASGYLRVGNMAGHDDLHLMPASEDDGEWERVKEIVNSAVMRNGYKGVGSGPLWSLTDIDTVMPQIVAAMELYGPRFLKHESSLMNLDYDDIPVYKMRSDLLRLEFANNEERRFLYFSGWSHPQVRTALFKWVGHIYAQDFECDFLENQTQDIGTTDVMVQYQNIGIALADHRPVWAESIYDAHVASIVPYLKKYDPTTYDALTDAEIKNSVLDANTCTVDNLLQLGTFFLVGRPPGLEQITYRFALSTVASDWINETYSVTNDSRSSWHFGVNKLAFSTALNFSAEDMDDGDLKTAVLNQAGAIESLSAPVKCTVLETGKTLSNTYATNGAYANQFDGGLADKEYCDGVMFADINWGRDIEGYITYDPNNELAERIFTSHLDLAKAKPWWYFLTPMSQTETDGAWTTNYKLWEQGVSGTVPRLTDLTTDDIKPLMAAGIPMYPESSGVMQPLGDSGPGIQQVTGAVGLTADVLMAQLANEDGRGIADYRNFVFDARSLTDDGLVRIDHLSSLELNMVDISYHASDQNMFINLAKLSLLAGAKVDAMV